MITEIKAIETQYKGYRFRSRIEAKWALFFDLFGVEWEYEAEGYTFDGQCYLPDFWFPKSFGGFEYAEVKPNIIDNKEKKYERILIAFVKAKKTNLIVLDGPPDNKSYFYLEYDAALGDINIEKSGETFLWCDAVWKANHADGAMPNWYVNTGWKRDGKDVMECCLKQTNWPKNVDIVKNHRFGAIA